MAADGGTSDAARRAWLAAATVGGLAFLAFLPTVGFDFVNWDDNEYVFGRDGLVAGGLSARNVWRAFTETVFRHWAPLTICSYQLDATIAGDRPWMYHLTNVILHALTASILCLALDRMTGNLPSSAAAATLFALHPLRVESVAWVAERKDVLSVFFLVLALLAYDWHCRRPAGSRFLAVAVAMLCSLLSKATVVTLPVLLLLLDVWPLGRLAVAGMGRPARNDRESSPYPARSPSQVLAEKIPLFALSALFSVITVATQGDAIKGEDAYPFAEVRVPNAIHACAWYLGRTIAPSGLHPAYRHPGREGRPPAVMIACVGVVAATALVGMMAWRSSPFITIGLAWFAVALLPVSMLLKQLGFSGHADRFTYVPHIGLLLALVWSADQVAARVGLSRATRRICFAIVAALCLVQTERQLLHWRDSESLWSHVLAIDSGSATALAKLGAHRFRLGQDADAEKLLFDALWIDPAMVWPKMYLAQIYHDAGEYRRAVFYRNAALRAAPADWEMRTMAAEMPHLDALAARPPRPRVACSAVAREELASGLKAAREERIDDAHIAFERAVSADPSCAAAHNNLGLTLARRGDHAAAVGAFRRASGIDAEQADYFVNEAQSLLALGRFGEANDAARTALRLAPWDEEAVRLRARCLQSR